MLNLVAVRILRNLFEASKQDAGGQWIEYALLFSLVALGTTALMGTVANGINTAFVNVGSKVQGSMSHASGSASSTALSEGSKKKD